MDYKKKNSSVSVILLFLFSEILHLSCFYVCDVLNKCVSGVEFFLSISIIFLFTMSLIVMWYQIIDIVSCVSDLNVSFQHF